MNRGRSFTAERLYRNNARVEVPSASVMMASARRLSKAASKWVEFVFVMEHRQKQWIVAHNQDLVFPWIDVLDVPDDFEVMDPALQELLCSLMDPEIDHLLSKAPEG